MANFFTFLWNEHHFLLGTALTYRCIIVFSVTIKWWACTMALVLILSPVWCWTCLHPFSLRTSYSDLLFKIPPYKFLSIVIANLVFWGCATPPPLFVIWSHKSCKHTGKISLLLWFWKVNSINGMMVYHVTWAGFNWINHLDCNPNPINVSNVTFFKYFHLFPHNRRTIMIHEFIRWRWI